MTSTCVRRQADLLVGLAQRGLDQRLAGVAAPAREGDLARVAPEVVAAAGEDGVQAAARVGEQRDEHGGVGPAAVDLHRQRLLGREELGGQILARGSGELDPLVEGDLALEGAVHRALGRDHLQALDLLLAEVRGHAHDQLEAGRAAALGGRVAAVDLEAVDVPALALGVHLHRHGGAGGEARRQQLLRARAHVLAALVDGLVDGDACAARS